MNSLVDCTNIIIVGPRDQVDEFRNYLITTRLHKKMYTRLGQRVPMIRATKWQILVRYVNSGSVSHMIFKLEGRTVEAVLFKRGVDPIYCVGYSKKSLTNAGATIVLKIISRLK